jgi:pimeloyl-ACP methyl ester carboxylesterase
VLPALLAQLDAPEPLLVGHSDGASIALVHAARHPVSGLALLAPHVFLEDSMVPPIRVTRREFEEGELRARLARHHDDPDVAFHGWCDVWLDPAMRDWSLEPEAAEVVAPTLLIQGAEDEYASLAHLERIEARVRGPVRRLVVPGGHSPHLEQAEAVVEAIAAFARGLP